MRLYGNDAAPTTRMVLICFAEKGAKPEFVSVNLFNGEQQSPEHLARHPFGLTPVLEDDHGFVYETRGILRYLDRVLPGPSLTPGAPRGYALMEQFIGVEQNYFSSHVMVHVYVKLLGRACDAATLAAATTAAGKALDVAEEALANSPYLAGETFSLAEIAWMPYLGLLFWTGNGDLVTSRPRVNDWWGRISARPSWVTTQAAS